LVLTKVRVPASQVRLGDLLVGSAGEPHKVVIQVTTRGGQVRLSHGSSQTCLMGDPLVWVLRKEPRVIDEELPDTIWRPKGPRRRQPWEGGD
jgi:hypothetical protein